MNNPVIDRASTYFTKTIINIKKVPTRKKIGTFFDSFEDISKQI